MMVSLLLCGISLAAPIERAEISESRPSSTAASSGGLVYQWVFCPSNRWPCDGTTRLPLWLDVEVNPDAFTARASASHESARLILDQSASDLKPIATAITRFLAKHGGADEVSTAGMAHGLVQGLQYAYDESTGWTEYPKYSLEFIVDQQGDCDDAAITTAALLNDLGLEAWVVSWRAAPPSRDGHLSTAVTPMGALTKWPLPAGSRFIPGPSGVNLLHVDGVGDVDRCENDQGCRSLGWNEWFKYQPPLDIEALARFSDADLDTSIPIAAWADNGQRRPNNQIVDRRKARPQDVLDHAREEREDPARVRAQLAGAGLSDADASAYLDAQTVDNLGYYGMSAMVVGAVLLVGAGVQADRRRRHRALALARARREQARF